MTASDSRNRTNGGMDSPAPRQRTRYLAQMRALSIRQPYVEEILRGIKPFEIRDHRTKKIGERFYIYAATKPGEDRYVKSRFRKLGAEVGGLPTGLILGTARISQVTRKGDRYYWHLYDVKRLRRPRKPTRHPLPRWFFPFQRPRCPK